MRRIWILLIASSPGCFGNSRAEVDDACDSCPEGQACDADGACRALCNSARDCAACDQCSSGFCQPLEDCDGQDSGGAGTPCVASAQCNASAPICDDVCRTCADDGECATRDAGAPFCKASGCTAEPHAA